LDRRRAWFPSDFAGILERDLRDRAKVEALALAAPAAGVAGRAYGQPAELHRALARGVNPAQQPAALLRSARDGLCRCNRFPA
jgi:hypothetical protein